MIIYKLVMKKEDGRRVSLMSPGKHEVEYKPGEVSNPPDGMLYAFDDLQRAEGYIYRCGVPTSVVELWKAEGTDVIPVPPWPHLVGCQSLTLLEKLFQAESRPVAVKEGIDEALIEQ